MPSSQDKERVELMREAKERTITARYDGDQWIISDEDGEFARAGQVREVLRYVEDLMIGPGTLKGPLSNHREESDG